MRGWLRLGEYAVLLLLQSQAGVGQVAGNGTTPPNQDGIAQLLRSGDPREQAWGAAWAMRERDRSFLRELTGMAAV